MSREKKLVVIDGKSVFYRGYYAMPNLSMPDGTPTGGVYGFGMMALEVVKKMKPDYVVVAWDKPKTNIRRRRKIYPQYKANRKPAPPDFYAQIPLLKKMLKAFGWPFYEVDDHEADDIMGTFAKQAAKKGLKTVLITSDKDVLQLVSDNTTVAILKKGVTNVEEFDAKHLRESLGMDTKQFVDYKALRGDPSDNLPGIAGVGEKTARQLIKDYGSLDNIYEHLNDIKPSLRRKLEEGKEMAYLTKKLVLLDSDISLKLDLKKADIHNLNPKDVRKVFKEFNFKTLLKQLPASMSVDDGEDVETDTQLGQNVDVKIISRREQLNALELNTAGKLAVHAVFADAQGRNMTALMISPDPKQAILFQMGKNLHPAEILAAIADLVQGEVLKLVGHNLKKLIKSILFIDFTSVEVAHDTKIGAFLLNPLEREQSLNALCQNVLGYYGSDLDLIAPDELHAKTQKVIAALWSLEKKQLAELKKIPKLYKLAQNIDWPTIKVLAKMEHVGIGLDTNYLKKMSKRLDDMISDLEQSIYGSAGMKFNIASPRQLAEVLFDKLKLPHDGIKRTKSGYSTAASELNKLLGKHEIVKYILSYRELTKLKNTYVDTLPNQIQDDGRVHTEFSLTTTATGRLSSRDPNLQNIPIRSELGREIRTAFVPRRGYVFVSADYSQFELRIAAFLSGDKKMIEAFNQGIDIHTQTAAELFDISEDKVTKDQRRAAKAVNFGVMYGQGPHGLSEGTGMDFAQAQEFIEKYFKIRPALKRYLDSIEQKAKEEGFVETYFGRRRPMPDINSSNFATRAAAKRAAINMPIQGTAADIMKMAMIKIDRELGDSSQILLQIHDSVLIESPKGDASAVAKQVKNIMENTVKLEVKLKVDTSVADNWGGI